MILESLADQCLKPVANASCGSMSINFCCRLSGKTLCPIVGGNLHLVKPLPYRLGGLLRKTGECVGWSTPIMRFISSSYLIKRKWMPMDGIIEAPIAGGLNIPEVCPS